jgi:hypothetical protein
MWMLFAPFANPCSESMEAFAAGSVIFSRLTADVRPKARAMGVSLGKLPPGSCLERLQVLDTFSTPARRTARGSMRPVRIGVLVNDSDDPAGKRKATIGLWRTAADVGENCTSMTTFVTEP